MGQGWPRWLKLQWYGECRFLDAGRATSIRSIQRPANDRGDQHLTGASQVVIRGGFRKLIQIKVRLRPRAFRCVPVLPVLALRLAYGHNDLPWAAAPLHRPLTGLILLGAAQSGVPLKRCRQPLAGLGPNRGPRVVFRILLITCQCKSSRSVSSAQVSRRHRLTFLAAGGRQRWNLFIVSARFIARFSLPFWVGHRAMGV